MSLLQTALSILVTLVVVVLIWKIFKKLIGAVILGIILLAILWYLGFLL